jgi:Uma2 family endonuclease
MSDFRTDGTGALKPEKHYTYKDYKEWELEPGERYELIGGVPFMMAAPSDYHQAISGEIFYTTAPA